jgi:photosystem II stability/assembly factor-like uncharacterized protein
MKHLLITIIITLFLTIPNFVQSGWTVLNSGTSEVLNSIDFPSSLIGYVVGKNGTVLKTTDGGLNWSIIPSGISDHLESVYFINNNLGFTGGWYGALHKTTNGGINWSPVTGISGAGSLYSIIFFDSLIGLAGGASPLFKTTNGGTNWNIIASNVAAYGLSFVNDTTGYSAGGNKAFKTINGGNNWSNVFTGLPIDLFLGTHFLNANFGFVVGDYSKVLKTTNGGTSWYTTTAGDLNHDILMFDEYHGYLVGTPGAIRITTDGGATWTVDYANYPAALFMICSPNPTTAFVCGSQGLLLKKDITTGIHSGQVLQKGFKVNQNFPNPFNPITTINYQIPKSSNVELLIYNIKGQLVRTLVNSWTEAGKHNVAWEGKNDEGIKISSGIYFYLFEASEFTKVRKMILVK